MIRKSNNPQTTGNNSHKNPHPLSDLASLLRGLYGRVARKLKVDPSYVSRVARSERHSEKIEAELRRQLGEIIKFAESRKSRKKSSGRKDR